MVNRYQPRRHRSGAPRFRTMQAMRSARGRARPGSAASDRRTRRRAELGWRRGFGPRIDLRNLPQNMNNMTEPTIGPASRRSALGSAAIYFITRTLMPWSTPVGPWATTEAEPSNSTLINTRSDRGTGNRGRAQGPRSAAPLGRHGPRSRRSGPSLAAAQSAQQTTAPR